MNSPPSEADRVKRFLSLMEPASGSSDHIDDDTLALVAHGWASAQELEAVRAHLVVCPPCRRLVAQIIKPIPARPWSWHRHPPAFLAAAVAACLLVSLTLLFWSVNRPRLADVLVAQVSLQLQVSRGDGSEQPAFDIKIESPRDGVAVVLGVANGRWKMLAGQRKRDEFLVKATEAFLYPRPIEPSKAPVDYVVVLSDSVRPGELAQTVRESLPSEPGDFEKSYKSWRDDLIWRLTRTGHKWLSIEKLRG
jgi:hypothetical protein